MLMSEGEGTYYVLNPVRITSVALTSEVATAAILKVHSGQDNLSKPIVTIHSVVNQTSQLSFKGIPCPDGFTLVNDAGVELGMIEYEPLTNDQK